MSGTSDFARNKLTDALFRAQALGAPANLFFGLITCTKGTRANSTAYALNDTLVVLIASGVLAGKYAYYKVTTAGTSAGAQPGTFLGAVGEVITDGTAVLTEQTAALRAGTGLVEVAGGSYARVSVAASLANFAGTQGAGTTVASSGSSGTTSNNAAITFPTPTAQWHPTGGAIVGMAVWDASTSGNPWHWSMLNAPKNVGATDPAPSFAISAWQNVFSD